MMPGMFPPSLCPAGSWQVQKPFDEVIELSFIGFVVTH